MSMDIIRSIEQEQLKSDIPDFRPGDTVRVDVKVVEELASIPPKEVLLGRMLGSLMGPLTGLAVGLQAVIDKANGGESAEEAPAEAEAPAAE